MFEFLEVFFSFPVAVYFIPCCFFLVLMIISITTGFLGDLNLDLDADLNMAGFHGFLLPIAITKVPLPISLLVTFFIGSILTYGVDLLLRTWPHFLYLTVIIIWLIMCLWCSLHIAAFILKPLLPLFDEDKTLAIVKYEGKIGIVKTMVVTHNSGDLEVSDDSLENHIDVYTDEEEGSLKYGDKALIISFNVEKNRYLVIKKKA